MPSRPRTRCPRCRRRRDAQGKCSPKCRAQQRSQSQRARGTTAEQGYAGEHVTRFRPGVLAKDPLCVLCGVEPSTVADHYPISRRELVARGLDPNDPQYGRGLCKRCDSAQTAKRQPGGWNRR